MSVSYAVSGDAFVADKPRVWIAALGGAPILLLLPCGDLAKDGTRALVVTPVESADATKAEHPVVFLQNFFEVAPESSAGEVTMDSRDQNL